MATTKAIKISGKKSTGNSFTKSVSNIGSTINQAQTKDIVDKLVDISNVSPTKYSIVSTDQYDYATD